MRVTAFDPGSRQHGTPCTSHGHRKASSDQKGSRDRSKRRRARQPLSFSMDDEAEEGIEATVGMAAAAEAGFSKKPRLGKDPTTDTSFLPDADRAAEEAGLRERLKQEWREEQARLKQEDLRVTYSYYDGSGHRRDITVTKGTTIAKFLEAVRQDLAKSFPEMKRISPDTLLYVKEDLIIPHNLTFYDLIATKARGKSGPLFEFSVKDDVRLNVDHRVEVTESHPGKIVERRWFDANKHVFPMSRWEVYDPTVAHEKYTTHGGEVRSKP